MRGCVLVILLALVLLVVGGPALPADELPLGFLVGLVAGLLLSLLGVYDLGWNSHVEHVRRRDQAKADTTADNDRR